MLSYQHGFHAGNRADVLKHAALDAILREETRAASPIFYIETHSGRGQYDLTGQDAQKTDEARHGIIRLLGGDPPRPLRSWTDLVDAQGVTAYPGSPQLAALHLRDKDRMAFFERHPTELKALKDVFADDDRALVRSGDGYSGALRLSPRRGERMIVFIDPSYETMDDMEALAEWAPRALNRWPEAAIIIWLPLFTDEREADFGAFLADLEDGYVAGARWPTDPDIETALSGTAIVAYRIQAQSGEQMTKIAASLQSYWSGS
ncbi:MAG: 23S rRNA (adenine(2030)-N(6))-methyltransferase RlmJ [Pseudomonadota bacterium]